MLQLELDPRFMPGECSVEEIELSRNAILRRRVIGGGIEWRKEKRYRSITFDTALLSLLNSAYYTLQKQSDAKGYELDLLAGQALKKTLPFVLGKKGYFETLDQFKQGMFIRIMRHVVIDHYRSESRSHKEPKDLDDQLVTETKKRKTEGFQPTLFRLTEGQTRTEQIMEQSLADLRDPDSVFKLGSEYLKRSPRYRQRALELRSQNPHFSSRDIVQILTLEGFKEFKDSTIRVWELRAARAQKYLTSA